MTPLGEYLEEACALLNLNRSKKLTVEGDTLNAFSGVLRVLQETLYGIMHLQGNPYPWHLPAKDADIVGLQLSEHSTSD